MTEKKLKGIGILSILVIVSLTIIIVRHFGDTASLVAALGIIFCVLAEQKIAFADAQGRLRDEIHDDRLRLNLVMTFLAGVCGLLCGSILWWFILGVILVAESLLL